MKTEQEFNTDLRRIMRHGRKKLNPYQVAQKMGLHGCEYYSYERGGFPIPAYKLYLFLHNSNMTMDDLQELFR